MDGFPAEIQVPSHEHADFLLDLEGRWGAIHYLGDNPSTLRSHEEALTSITRRRLISEHPIHGIWIITDAEGNRLGNLLFKPIPLSAGLHHSVSPPIPDAETWFRPARRVAVTCFVHAPSVGRSKRGRP